MPEKQTKQPTPELTPEASALTPAGESSNPAVHQLLAELATARTNGATDDEQDIVGYLAQLGFSA